MLKTLRKRISNQLVRRHRLIAPVLPGGYRPYPFPGGKIFLDLKKSDTMLQRYFGFYEPMMYTEIQQTLHPGAVFVDIGACLGEFSLFAARTVGETGKILAFEPEPENCHWLKESIALNGYSNISLYEMALGDSNESAVLYLGRQNGWHSLVTKNDYISKEHITVPKRKLDDVISEAGLHQVNLIKIDVEGAELEVLHGAAGTLSANQRVIVLVEVHRLLGIDFNLVIDFLEGHGFKVSPIGSRVIHQFKAQRPI